MSTTASPTCVIHIDDEAKGWLTEAKAWINDRDSAYMCSVVHSRLSALETFIMSINAVIDSILPIDQSTIVQPGAVSRLMKSLPTVLKLLPLLLRSHHVMYSKSLCDVVLKCILRLTRCTQSAPNNASYAANQDTLCRQWGLKQLQLAIAGRVKLPGDRGDAYHAVAAVVGSATAATRVSQLLFKSIASTLSPSTDVRTLSSYCVPLIGHESAQPLIEALTKVESNPSELSVCSDFLNSAMSRRTLWLRSPVQLEIVALEIVENLVVRRRLLSTEARLMLLYESGLPAACACEPILHCFVLGLFNYVASDVNRDATSRRLIADFSVATVSSRKRLPHVHLPTTSFFPAILAPLVRLLNRLTTSSDSIAAELDQLSSTSAVLPSQIWLTLLQFPDRVIYKIYDGDVSDGNIKLLAFIAEPEDMVRRQSIIDSLISLRNSLVDTLHDSKQCFDINDFSVRLATALMPCSELERMPRAVLWPLVGKLILSLVLRHPHGYSLAKASLLLLTMAPSELSDVASGTNIVTERVYPLVADVGLVMSILYALAVWLDRLEKVQEISVRTICFGTVNAILQWLSVDENSAKCSSQSFDCSLHIIGANDQDKRDLMLWCSSLRQRTY